MTDNTNIDTAPQIEPYGVASEHQATEQRHADETLWGKHGDTFRIMNRIFEISGTSENEDGEFSRRSPATLVQNSLLHIGDRVRHKPSKPRGAEVQTILDEIEAELVVNAGRYEFQWISGGNHVIKGTYSATGLLDAIYKENDRTWHGSGNTGAGSYHQGHMQERNLQNPWTRKAKAQRKILA